MYLVALSPCFAETKYFFVSPVISILIRVVSLSNTAIPIPSPPPGIPLSLPQDARPAALCQIPTPDLSPP